MRNFIIKLHITLLFPFSFSFSQDLTLEYIFQEPGIINPRPSLKTINTKFSKIFYYADEDFDGKLSLFDYNYFTGEYFKYENVVDEPSEFVILPSGDALCIFDGDIYISNEFCQNRSFSRDIKLTETPEQEYSPQIISESLIVFRRKGNYYLLMFDEKKASKEFVLTNDESDSVSYQLSAFYSGRDLVKIFMIRYDNSPKKEFIFPDYTDELVKIKKGKRGFSNISFHEIIILPGKDSIIRGTGFYFPDSSVYSASSVFYSYDGISLVIDSDSKYRNVRKIFRYESESKKMTEIYSEYFSEWYERHSNKTCFIDSNTIIFESERDGFNGLYRLNINDLDIKRISPPGCTIVESFATAGIDKIYFIANIKKPWEYNLYETDFYGDNLKNVFNIPGSISDIKLSGDNRYIFIKHSHIIQPPELYVIDTETFSSMRITNTVSQAFASINWVIPEIINFRNQEDGETIHAFLYKPRNFKKGEKYPLICFVHGAGYLQNVTAAFSPYQDNFMVNTFFTERGFVVLDVDFRGSAGYGMKFRNKTYKNLGYWEVSDYISGILYLDSLGIIDRSRVGIYGGSYGGFVTLMSVFRRPDVFSCGVSLRAVTDWKNYYYSNPWYTMARLGDYNDENRFYYEISSPLTYAENLSVPLLLTHGMLDDNVFFQDMVELTQKLIDSRKDFEIMIHPSESHSYYRQTSWLDLYKRIWRFFEKNLK